MTEIHFIVEEAPEGGFVARGVGTDIVTEADDLPSLQVKTPDNAGASPRGNGWDTLS